MAGAGAAEAADAAKALGAGAQNLGNSLIAFDRAERERADQIALNEAKNVWVLNKANLDQSLATETDLKRINEFYPDAYRTAAEASRESLNDTQRVKFDEWATPHLVSGIEDVQKRARGIEIDQGKATVLERVTKFKDLARRSKTQDEAVGQLPNIGREVDNALLKGYISNEQAFHMKEAATKEVMTDWLQAQDDHTQLSILRPANVDEAVKQGAKFFQSKGWEPHQASGIMGHLLYESGGKLDPNAINRGDGRDGSDSIGIGQWNGERAKALKAFAAARGKPWNDLATQFAFAQHEFETTEAGAAAALKGAKTVDDAVSAGLKYERPKGFEGGLTTAAGGRDRLRYGRAIFGQLHEGATPTDTRIAQFIDPDKAKQMADAAEKRIIQQEHLSVEQRRAESATLNNLIKDDTMSVMTTGKEVPDLTPERVASVFGQEKAAEFVLDRTLARDYYTQTHDILSLPADEIPMRVEALRPAPGAPGFAQRQKYYEAAAKTAAEVTKQRTTDPAAAADQLEFLKPAASAASFDRPETYKPVVGARMAAQEQLGVPEAYRSPITRAEALELWNTVRFAPEDRQPEAIREVVNTIEASFGEYSDQALGSMLRFARVDKTTREQAAHVLKKLAKHEPATVEDARAMDQAETVDLSQKAVNGVLPVEMDIPESAAIQAMNAPTFPIPSDKAISALVSNPAQAALFDKKFGPGSAEKFLKLHGG